MSADRYGVNKKKIGPLAKASFEQTEDIMLRAAMFGELDPITGVSANIMTGQSIRGGTAFTGVLLDEEMFSQLMAAAPPRKRIISRVPTMTAEQIRESMVEVAGCSVADIRMRSALPGILEEEGEGVGAGVGVGADMDDLPDMDIVLVDE